ncbi:MAG: sigma-70 family RNA polymerase sigma factor [Candidatus Dojkabacteria bacterium]|nr:MAG: sigma-70 family RNA polymerase sigma factor [Candidatus Dojkabacteria bacterium]
MNRRTVTELDKLAVEAANDKESFGRLYEETYDKLFRYLYWKCGDRDTCEDLLSEVYVTLLEKIHEYDYRRASFVTWLYKIAANRLTDRYRMKEIESIDMSEAELALEGDEVEAQVEIEEFVREVRKLAEVLSYREREIFFMRYGMELSNKEISEALSIREKSVSSTLSKATNRLRDLYSDKIALQNNLLPKSTV